LTDERRPASRPITPVAVGVLVRADGAVLLADRPAGKPYAGYWEFPGGKMQSGESVEQALKRELAEELGVCVRASDPWVVLEHDYPHAYVRLHFQRIFDWVGTPHPVEGQRLIFLPPGELAPSPLLPAAVLPLRWMQLPAVTGYSQQTSSDAHEALQWIEGALARGLRQILWYEPMLTGPARWEAARGASARARAYGARLLIDSRMDDCALALGQGCFLGAETLRGSNVRPRAPWVGAAVQTPTDLERATALACDFAVIEPAPADSSAGAEDRLATWERIGALCRQCPLPLYADLALSVQNLRQARRYGAHGLAVHLPR